MKEDIITVSGLRLYYELQDFFPRKNPDDESSIDDGQFKKNLCGSDDCYEQMFETKSIEYCPTCGYFVDFWAEDENTDNSKYLTSCGPVHLEEWCIRKRLEKILLNEGYEVSRYTLDFHLNKKEDDE